MTNEIRTLVVLPVYNHRGALRRVALGTLAMHPDVLVVDDGSTDGGPATLAGLPLNIATHDVNLGKGAAILTAAAWAREHNYTHIVTIDADGQHDPADIPAFLRISMQEPDALVVGVRDFDTPNVPKASRFGRTFSNFWLRVQTGQSLADVQSGFRCYPLDILKALDLREKRYSFEVEVLVKAAWAGFALREIPVTVHYPPKQERISHFDTLADNVRISLLNTRLTARAMMPLPQRKMVRDAAGTISVLHPLNSLRNLLAMRATPLTLGLSGGFGCLVGALPLPGFSCLIILLASGYLRLNKFAALATNQLCIPPFVQAAAVLVGYYLRHGHWLTEFSVETLGYQAGQRLYEWVLGSLVVAPIMAVVVGFVVYALALLARMTLRETTL